MSNPAQSAHEAQFQPQPQCCSLLDGVVVFPDGSVMWIPDSAKQSPASAPLEDSTSPPVLAATANRLPVGQPGCVYYLQLLPEPGATSRFWATSLGVAIALIVLFPIACVLPQWSNKWQLETSRLNIGTCLQNQN